MSTVKLALISAVLAEAVACLTFSLSYGGGELYALNPVALVVYVFHLPGVILAEGLFPDSWIRTGWVEPSFLILTGAIQWFLLAYCIITAKRRFYGHNRA